LNFLNCFTWLIIMPILRKKKINFFFVNFNQIDDKTSVIIQIDLTIQFTDFKNCISKPSGFCIVDFFTHNLHPPNMYLLNQCIYFSVNLLRHLKDF